MKLKSFWVVVGVTLFMAVLGTSVLAQEEPPPPYAGLQNIFSWDDDSAQTAGRELYPQFCLGCHGISGDNLKQADFSASDYPGKLELNPDYYFWVLSEGRTTSGMPSYKSSISEEQRWQVITYLWTLGGEVSGGETPLPVQPPEEIVDGILIMRAPDEAQAGQPIIISATLRDKESNPVVNAPVRFYIQADFFTTGFMEIGEELTNEQGIAVLNYIPRQDGQTRLAARYGAIETTTVITLTAADEPFYQPAESFQLPALGPEVLIGPESALEINDEGKAPTSAFRLPGGIISWLLLLVAAIILIWATYFRVIYQVYLIPVDDGTTETDIRRFPMFIMIVIVIVGIALTLMLLTGPHTYIR